MFVGPKLATISATRADVKASHAYKSVIKGQKLDTFSAARADMIFTLCTLQSMFLGKK